MLFNSFDFIFLFLPILLVAVYSARHYSLSFAHVVMIIASLYFYALLDISHLPVLMFSACVNYGIGIALSHNGDQVKNRYPWLIIGIIFNLVLLGGYKYIGFFTHIFGIEIAHIAAPLGISFFTFHQLAYLIDIHRQRIRPTGVRDYALYVTFFPHLIAGPIMRYGQFSPQLSAPSPIAYGAGIFFFSAGLFKKTVLADTFAPIADRVFDTVTKGEGVVWIEAWKGAFAYAWQIYFDFSGYADMAIGLGLLMGIALPVNFLSPYKATSMSDFWRRWHITLSQFLRDYVYIPLGGSRHGKRRQIAALIVTMALAGLWHGAAWTFILWGTLHGILLGIVHVWRVGPGHYIPIPRFLAVGLTFVTVLLLWVLFRSNSWHGAVAYYQAMGALSSLSQYPNEWTQWLSDPLWREWIWIMGGGLVVFALKPTSYWVGYDHNSPVADRLHTTLWHAVISAALVWMALKTMTGEPARSFVYFVF